MKKLMDLLVISLFLGCNFEKTEEDIAEDYALNVAKYEMDCPRSLLKSTVFSVSTYDADKIETMVGIEGCGLRKIYKVFCNKRDCTFTKLN